MNLQARTIAAIDDDPRVLESLVNLLALSDYEGRRYISAEQFLQAVDQERAVASLLIYRSGK